MKDIRTGSHRWSRVARRCLLLVVLAGGLLLAAPSPSQASFPGANGLIAFARQGRIWVTDTDGNASKLARGGYPAWSPDGTRIAFDRNNAGTGNWHIWTMLADGSQITRMTSGMGANIEPTWSPDGTELAFAHFGYGADTDYDLFSIDASVSLAPFAPPSHVTDTPAGDERHPVWAPDGSRVAFDRLACPSVCGYRIGTVAPDGSSYRMITPLTSDYETSPDWSPDSNTLLFDSDRNGPSQAPQLYTMSVSGENVTQITTGGASNDDPAWSPDGTMIVYIHRTRSGRESVQIAEPDGSSSVHVTRTGYLEGFPDWQPLP
jgi:Tol biopolymer transport system component